MTRPLTKLIAVSMLVAVVFCFILAGRTDASTISLFPSPFQSGLPQPEPNRDPHYILSSTGGRVTCKLAQNSVWLQIPEGFTDGSGADMFCDITNSLSTLPNEVEVWDGSGYLLGTYVPSLQKPLMLVFDIEASRSRNICAKCWSARYYDAVGRKWDLLPTTFSSERSQVYVTLSTILPPSQYPGYSDRGLVALFIQTTTATAQPTSRVTRASATSTKEIALTVTPEAETSSATKSTSSDPGVLIVVLAAGVIIGLLIADISIRRSRAK